MRCKEKVLYFSVRQPPLCWLFIPTSPKTAQMMSMCNRRGERPHNCSECEKSFGQIGDLKRHMLTHSGVKTHTCSECEKSFSQAGNLTTHMCRRWKFIWSTWKLETAHAHPQWGEATQVPTMRLCIFTHRRSKSSHQNTSLKKAKSMQMVRLLFNHKIKP